MVGSTEETEEGGTPGLGFQRLSNEGVHTTFKKKGKVH